VTPLPTAPRTNEAIRPAALKQELGAVRFVRKPLLKCEERVRNGHRRRSCSVGGSESSETWDNGISPVLTTEEEGIGYLAGAWLGGERGALLMQSSGVGNCINTLALQVCARFPLLTVITMRGDWAEFNAWQNPMGQVTEKALNLMGVLTWRADETEEVAPLLHGAATMAFNGDTACALLLGQRLIGEKKWVK
jgi:sulfopyruvate decarboxylase TPP-binding subunit